MLNRAGQRHSASEQIRSEQAKMRQLAHSQSLNASKVLSVNELHKVYGETVAVDGISFEVGSNQIVGLLGPNGAGKTTTINMILGVLELSSGTIRIQDVDIATERSRALERTNFAAVYAPLPGNLTVYQNLRIFGLLYGVKGLSERIEILFKQLDLDGFREIGRA